jgi:hypothetical protein
MRIAYYTRAIYNTYLSMWLRRTDGHCIYPYNRDKHRAHNMYHLACIIVCFNSPVHAVDVDARLVVANEEVDEHLYLHDPCIHNIHIYIYI